MRICFYSDFAGSNPGGAQKILALLIEGAYARGHEVSVFCPSAAVDFFKGVALSSFPRQFSKRYAVRAQVLPFFLKHYKKHPFDLWKKAFKVNIDAVHLCTQQVIGIMKKRRSGSIINISSNYGSFHSD